MKELIDQVVAKVGISPEQAESSVAAVMEFLEDKLPAPIAEQLNHLVSGEGAGGNNPLEAAKDLLGGFFGGKD